MLIQLIKRATSDGLGTPADLTVMTTVLFLFITYLSLARKDRMALFRMLWLRRIIRRNTSPIPEENAALWKRRLSLGYMILAWNAFGFVVYMIFDGKADWAKGHGLVTEDPGTPAVQWSKTLGIKSATVYKVSGFNVKKYNINNESETITPNEITNSVEETGTIS